MMAVRGFLVVCVSLVVSAGLLQAAPSLPVTSPPVQPETSWTGPEEDPHAEWGQWFRDLMSEMESYRTHEFYDNVSGSGGGNEGPGAIRGVAENLQYDGDGLLIGFNIRATIYNDTLTQSGPWADGQNAHGEGLGTELQWQNTLYDTVMTVEFAVDEDALNAWLEDNEWGSPYLQPAHVIAAQNHDQVAWYCWNPDSGNSELEPHGAYLVPAWDFGDILPGEESVREMEFIITDGLAVGNPIRTALESGNDVFLNRTTSLKISDWVDTVRQDTGTPYDEIPSHNSNVSVFHNIPEPGTGIALMAGLLALYAARRRKF